MPRDASGSYTLPEAPFQPQTVAQSARVNHNFSDIAAALTDSFSISLGAPMQGPLNMNGQPITNLGSLAVGGNVTATGNITTSGQFLGVGSDATGNPTLIVNGAAGTARQVAGETASKARWIVVLGDGAAEGTGNVGSNFAISRYADDGLTSLGTPLQINRATGQVTTGQVTVNGTLSVGGSNSIITGGTMLCGHLAAGKAGQDLGGFVGSWNVVRNGYTGFWTAADGTLTFGTADAALGTIIGTRGTLDASGTLTVPGSIRVGGIGVVYTGVGGSDGIAFAWTGAGPGNSGVNVYVNTTWVGRMFLDTSGTPLTERLDALEARIAALEAARV